MPLAALLLLALLWLSWGSRASLSFLCSRAGPEPAGEEPVAEAEAEAELPEAEPVAEAEAPPPLARLLHLKPPSR